MTGARRWRDAAASAYTMRGGRRRGRARKEESAMPRTRSLPRPLRVGLIGHPVDHSRSPAMQQAAFDALRLDIRYELWDTPTSDLRKRIESLRQPGYLGANVTIPHKIAALPHLDSRSASARWLAGAVNTIVREETPVGGARLVGHNTDTTDRK